MLANIFIRLFTDPWAILGNPVLLVLTLFQLWMIIHAIQNQEYMWAAFMIFFPLGINAILYFFLRFRHSASISAPTFELPGAATRRRIQELQGQIHHLDKAHHHSQLADVYFAQGKLAEAEKEYRAAMERDGEDEETLAHFGQCLLRLNRPNDALPLLQKVCAANPEHEYGQTMMTLAETLAVLGQKEASIAAWQRVLQRHSYASARVGLARLLIEKGDLETARRELSEVVADASHLPAFQRRREKPYVKIAQSLLRTIPAK